MRLLIVGVGQTLNFETKQMEDVLQVMAPDGSVFSVPTTNEAAQGLVKLAMNGDGHHQLEHVPVRGDGFVAARGLIEGEESGERMSNAPYPAKSTGNLSGEPFPDGAEVFGGEISAAPQEEPRGLADGNLPEEPDELGQKIFAKTQRTSGKAKTKLGLRRNPADRSGVPSYGIARVDERGNPILPAPPDSSGLDDDDPGEQV